MAAEPLHKTASPETPAHAGSRRSERSSSRRLWRPALIVAGAPALAGGAEEASDWLERMAAAMNHMSYQGTFVYVQGDSVETQCRLVISQVLGADVTATRPLPRTVRG